MGAVGTGDAAPFRHTVKLGSVLYYERSFEGLELG